MLTGHLGGEDAYTFVGEGGGVGLTSITVFKRDVIAREVLCVLLDFEIGARILVSSGGHYGMEWNGMEWNVLLYYIITLLLMEWNGMNRLKLSPETFRYFVAEGLWNGFPVFGVTKTRMK